MSIMSLPLLMIAQAAAPVAVKGTTVSELKGLTKPMTGLQQAVVRNMLESLKVGHR